MSRKLGLVGGLGPASTLDYYRGINDGYRARTGGDGNPPMIIDSLNLAEAYALVSERRWVEFTDLFVRSLRAIAANTAHIVFDEIASQSPLPLVSIVEETCREARARGRGRVVVFGTAFTMSSGLYTDAFARHGIDALVPTADEQRAIHGVIFPHLQEGIVRPEDKQAVLGIANRMISEERVDALILGCTELPLIIQGGDLDVPLLDTTRIHVDAILSRMLA